MRACVCGVCVLSVYVCVSVSVFVCVFVVDNDVDSRIVVRLRWPEVTKKTRHTTGGSTIYRAQR